MALEWAVLYGVSSASFVALNRDLLRRGVSAMVLLGVQQAVVLVVYITLRRRRLFNFAGLKACLPVTLAFLAMILANQWCLKLSSVGTYTVARSSNLIFSLALSRLCLPQTVASLNRAHAIGCGLVSLSIAVASRWTQCSLAGFVAGLGASVAQAGFSILILKTMKRTAAATVLTSSPNVCGSDDGNAAPFDSPLALLGHYTLITTIVIWTRLLAAGLTLAPAAALEPGLAPLVLLSGVANAVTAISGINMLQTKTPVFVSLVGYLKTAMQLILARWWLGEVLRKSELITVTGTFLGSLIYSLGAHWQFFGTRKIKL